MVDKEIKHLLENVSQNQNDAQECHPHKGRHAERAQEIAVENLQERENQREKALLNRKSCPCTKHMARSTTRGIGSNFSFAFHSD